MRSEREIRRALEVVSWSINRRRTPSQVLIAAQSLLHWVLGMPSQFEVVWKEEEILFGFAQKPISESKQ